MTVPAQVAADSVRAALDRVFAGREYDWEEARSPFTLFRDVILGLARWMVELREEHPLASWVLTIGAFAVLAAILAHWGWLIWRALRPQADDTSGAHVTRVKPRDGRWHLRQAERLAGEARYAEALGHRFRALVLNLHDVGALAFHPSKTPAEYASELRASTAGTAAFAEIVGRLYGVLFGRSPCDAHDVVQFDQLATQVVRHVAPD